MPDFATTLGGDDRPRRRHRLRPLHRHPLPGAAPPRPLDVRESTSIAIDTAGRAVLFAGTTVVISLLGMLVMGVDLRHRPRHRRRRRRRRHHGRLAHPAPRPARLRRRTGSRSPAGGASSPPPSSPSPSSASASRSSPLDHRHPAGRSSCWSPASSSPPCAGRCRSGPPSRPSRPSPTAGAGSSSTIRGRPSSPAPVVLVLLALPVFALRLGFSDEGNDPSGHHHPAGLRPPGRRASAPASTAR